MSIRFDVPSDLERELRAAGVDLDREAKEGFFVGLYRRGRITHDDLSGALGLGFEQTQQLLKDHGVGDDYTLEEVRSGAGLPARARSAVTGARTSPHRLARAPLLV